MLEYSQCSLPTKSTASNVLVCESCQLAKSKCLPFTLSSRHFNDYEELTAFIKFKCFVENKFPTKIKAFQFDGGGEFTSSNQTHNGIQWNNTQNLMFLHLSTEWHSKEEV